LLSSLNDFTNALPETLTWWGVWLSFFCSCGIQAKPAAKTARFYTDLAIR
jgi:hypothetical protein